ncbi:PREDICTED: BTB/POZ domain-containing protein At3g49900-like [Camelina sativa]|uniref:BTB/POZ domain-containing protein At3g49900-like n=1 Tax=Camelina sativa TaxID=90675 RepID=A0ABM0ZGC4_CAMSA|nr:PREDICTED: BTB/POZ domain-containing protein At3g49900-like [Camelina sativa]
MKRWTNLGFVDTIYEEEDYVDHSNSSFSSSSSSLSLSPHHHQRRINLSSSPSMEVDSRVHKWSLANNSKPDVFVNVGGTRFHLHKDPLSTRSGYLKRHLTGVKELTLSPPLNITAETFSLVASFCYGAHVELTPFNVVSLRVAVELLHMTTGAGGGDGGGRESLRNLTESYLRRVVFVNVDYIQIVLRSCLLQLPESETSVFLVGRCVEALTEIGDGDCVNEFLEEAVSLPAGDFSIVADAVQQRFPRHDLLYRIVDAYVKEHDGEITEEEKVRICNSIDCDKLSPPLLLHSVQNPKMPLRFIVRAMLQEQLNTRHSIMAAAAVASTAPPVGGRHRDIADARDSSVTLGSLLQRDTAARQNCRLRAAMNSTSSRIESLEKELDAMKIFLSKESEKQKSERIIIESRSRSVMDSTRSASFHCVQQPSNVNKTHRGERGSVSNLSTTFQRRRASPHQPQPQKSLRKRLIKGIKNAFSTTSNKQGAKKNEYAVEEIYDGLEDFVWIKDDDDDDNISEELHSHYIKNK